MQYLCCELKINNITPNPKLSSFNHKLNKRDYVFDTLSNTEKLKRINIPTNRQLFLPVEHMEVKHMDLSESNKIKRTFVHTTLNYEKVIVETIELHNYENSPIAVEWIGAYCSFFMSVCGTQHCCFVSDPVLLETKSSSLVRIQVCYPKPKGISLVQHISTFGPLNDKDTITYMNQLIGLVSLIHENEMCIRHIPLECIYICDESKKLSIGCFDYILPTQYCSSAQKLVRIPMQPFSQFYAPENISLSKWTQKTDSWLLSSILFFMKAGFEMSKLHESITKWDPRVIHMVQMFRCKDINSRALPKHIYLTTLCTQN
jgi:serine/threonine protein kinase